MIGLGSSEGDTAVGVALEFLVVFAYFLFPLLGVGCPVFYAARVPSRIKLV